MHPEAHKPNEPSNSAEIQGRMQRGVYAAAAGMTAAEQYLDVIAHNLANASTTGFKREDVSFNEGLLRLMRDEKGKGPSIGELGAGPNLQERMIIWDVGNAIHTGNPLEVAIQNPQGLFAVQTPTGTSYTRSGSFTLNDQKQLVTRDGYPVLDTEGSPIQFPFEAAKLDILEGGQVMADGVQITQIGLFQGEAQRLGNSLFSLSNPTPVDSPRFVSRAVEASNVNAVEQMISMIKVHRAFEMSQKSATSQDEATGNLIQSLNQR